MQVGTDRLGGCVAVVVWVEATGTALWQCHSDNWWNVSAAANAAAAAAAATIPKPKHQPMLTHSFQQEHFMGTRLCDA